MSPANARTTVLAYGLVGAISGLAWGAALRAYMSEIIGPASTVTWAGTFIGVLLPALLAGGCLGAAAAVPVSPAHPRLMRWLAASPLLLALAPLLLPDALTQLFTQGVGGGAIGLAVGGIAGGYAIGGEHHAARIGTGTLALAVVVGVASAGRLAGGYGLGAMTPRGAWATVLAASLTVVLCIACSIPFRRLTALRQTARGRRPESSTHA